MEGTHYFGPKVYVKTVIGQHDYFGVYL